MDLDTLSAFEGEIAKVVPGFEVCYKDQSKSQKLIGWLSWPFNSDYMTGFTTTFYPRVYFPSRSSYLANPLASFITLAHESVHMRDTQRHPWWFRFSYMLPQALTPILLALYVLVAGAAAWPLAALAVGVASSIALGHKSRVGFIGGILISIVATGILAVMTAGWPSMLFFAGILMAMPWPARWRSMWEVRGYSMNLAVLYWTIGAMSPKWAVTGAFQKSFILQQFVGPQYFFMSWESKDINERLSDTFRRLRDGSLLSDLPFRFVYDFLKSRKLVVE